MRVRCLAMTAITVGGLLAGGCASKPRGLVAEVDNQDVRGPVIVTGSVGLEDDSVRDAVRSYSAHGPLAVLHQDRVSIVEPGKVDQSAGALCDEGILVSELNLATGVWTMHGGPEAMACLWSSEVATAELDRLHRSGILVGGSGWSGTMTGEYAVSPTAGSARSLADGFGAGLSRGRAYAPDMVFVNNSGTEDRLGVLLAVLMESDAMFGVLLDGGGVLVEPDRGRLQAIGSKPTVFINMTDARVSRSKRRIENARLFLLCPGDTWDLEENTMRYVAAKSATAGRSLRNMPEQRDAWADGTMLRLIRLLTDSQRGTSLAARSSSGGTSSTIRVSSDVDTRFFRALDSESTPDDLLHTILNVRLDVLPVD